MCGRFTRHLTWSEIVRLYRITATPNTPPSWNVAPTDEVPIVRAGANGAQELANVRWGLVPTWAKDTKGAARCINARAETVADKPAFRAAFKARRCLIPADGFYEWTTEDGAKQPHHICRRDGGPFSFAGLWERNDRLQIETCAIVTTTPNTTVAPIHDRMPVLLAPEDYNAWLDTTAPQEQSLALLKPCPEDWLRVYRVSRAVNSVKNNGPECIAAG